jgi:hypothetical protein
MAVHTSSFISQRSLPRRQEILPGDNTPAGFILKISARLAGYTAKAETN